MPEISEFQVQRSFVMWFAGVKFGKGHPLAGQYKIIPARLPGVVSWHTPNQGGEGEEHARRGKYLKDMGVEAGIPDYFMLWGGLHALEFKRPKGGRESTEQSAMQIKMHGAGLVGWLTTNSLRAAAAQVIAWGLVRADATVPPFAC